MLQVVSIEQTSRATANPNLRHCWNETKQSIKLKDLTVNIAEGITPLHRSVYVNLDGSFSNSECKSKCRNHRLLSIVSFDTCSTQQGVLLLSCGWRSAT